MGGKGHWKKTEEGSNTKITGTNRESQKSGGKFRPDKTERRKTTVVRADPVKCILPETNAPLVLSVAGID